MNYLVRWPLTFNRIRKDKISNTYGEFTERYSGVHWGWDFTAKVGTPIYAIADGTIALVYGKASDSKDFGLTAVLRFDYQGKTFYAAYCHLSRVTVKEGKPVKVGELIGYTGKSGNACNLKQDEDHLHFEIRSEKKPKPGGHPKRIDPRQIYNVCPLNHTIVDTIGND